MSCTCQQHAEHHFKMILLLILSWAISCRAVADNDNVTTTQQPGAQTTDAFIANNCQLQIQVPEIDEQDYETQPHIIYVNLKFKNLDLDPNTGYLSNRTHYIAPHKWTIASGRRGDLLLEFPAIFKPLSLWSLSFDIKSVSAHVDIGECPGFESESDTIKQEAVARALLESVNSSSIDLPDFKVCQEIAHLPSAVLGDTTWLALLLNIYFVVYNTRNECWSEGTQDSLVLEIYVPPLWLTVPIIILGIIGAVVLPFVGMRFIQRNNAPYVKEIYRRDEQDSKVATGKVNKYYHKLTNVPLGMKYILFNYSSPVVVFFRFIIACALIYITLCPDILFLLDDSYPLRFHAYQRNDFIRISYNGYNVTRALVLLFPLLWFLPSLPMIFRNAYKFRRFKMSDTPSGLRPYHAESALERSYFGLFQFPDAESHIKPPPGETTGLSSLYYYMISRIQTSLKVRLLYRCYTYNLARVWNGVVKVMWPPAVTSIWNVTAAVTCTLTIASLMLIVAPFNLILLCFSTLVYLLPSAYILFCITNTHTFVVTFTNWVYNARMWKWLGRQCDTGSSNDENAVGAEADEEDCSGKMERESDPKETVVKFRKGSGDSAGGACIEHVFTPEGQRSTSGIKYLPLPQFYASIYKYLLPDEEAEGWSRSANICLKVVFVLFAALLTLLLLVAILAIVVVLLFVISGIIMLLSTIFVVYFLRIIALCTLLSSIVVLSFTGLVVNSLRVIPYCLLGLALLGFIIGSVTGLYGTYSNLLKLVIETTRVLRPELCFVLIERISNDKVEDGADGNDDDDDGDGDDAADDEDVIAERKAVKVVPINTLPEVTSDMEADKMIEERLFWHVVESCLPLRVQVMSEVIQIVVVVVAVVVAIAVLVDIGELRDFEPFGVNLCILVITLVVTHIRSLISVSKEEEKEYLERGVKKAVIGFKETKQMRVTVSSGEE